MISLLMSLNLVFAQTEAPPLFPVSGQVLERGTKKSLADVNVFFLPSQTKAVTDKKGEFSIEVPQGDNELVINLTDYEKLTRKIEIGPSTQKLRLLLQKSAQNYFETTITDARNRRDDTERRLKQADFLTAPGSGGDPVKAVQNLPGVNRVASGDARVVIQGAEPEDTQYNIEGHDVPLVFHFGGLSSIVTPEAVDSVNYLSAGYGPEFGRALGGHVGLSVRKPKADRTSGMAFMDIFNLGGLVEGPIGEKSSYMASGRYSYVGEVFKSIAKDNENFNLTVAPVFYDFNAQYHRKLEGGGDFRLFSIFSKDRLEFVLTKPINNDPLLRGNFEQETWFYRVIPQWSKKISETKKVEASIGFGANDILFDVENTYFRLSSNTLSVRADYEYKPSLVYKTNLGLDNEYTWFGVDVRAPRGFSEGGVSNPASSGELRDAHLKGKDNQLAVYWRNEIKPSRDSSWTFLPNLRAARFARTKENFLEPRGTIRYALSPSASWRVSSGIYHQSPSGQETDRSFGNPNLKSPQATHYALGYEKDFSLEGGEGVLFSMTGFYKNLARLVESSSAIVSRDGTLQPENYSNGGTGRIHGVETQIRHKSRNLTLTLAYTYLSSRRKTPGEKELPSPFDQNHSVNFLSSYAYHSWLFGARARFVTGNPYTPVVGGIYDADNDVYLPVRGEIYSKREKPFFQLDVRIDRKWIRDNYILTAYLDIQNVTGRRNQEGVVYSYDYSDSDSVTGLPTLPTLGVKGEF